MRGPVALGAVALGLTASSAAAQGPSSSWDFESAAVRSAPAGFAFARTGEGNEARWVVRSSEGAPSGTHVLVQEDLDPTRLRFPLAVAEAPLLADVRAEVRCKLVAGRVDQACGLVVRYRDRDNYYVARANALEGNVRVYRVKDGTREELASWSGPIEAGRWYALALQALGDRLVVAWNGADVLDVRDATLPGAGRAGLWTKADSLTEYDDFAVTALSRSAQ